ncbi:MAG: hypothetical protein ACK56I_15165, partial [bacterium]
CQRREAVHGIDLIGERFGFVFEAPELQHKAPILRIALPFAFATGPAFEVAHGRVAVDAGDLRRIRDGPVVAIQTTAAEADECRFFSQPVFRR